jgi:hypothetical protein
MPRSPLKVNRSFGGACHFHLYFQRKRKARKQCEVDDKQSLLFYPETKECSTETSVDFQRITQHNVPPLWETEIFEIQKSIVAFRGMTP